MKKVLYSTTFLAAASLAFGAQDAEAKKAKPLSIGVGGYMKQVIGFAEQSGSFESTAGDPARVGYDSFNVWQDSEIYFRGSTKLDNGVGVSVTVQLETDDPNDAASIDESYMALSGGFGDIHIGGTKKASVKLGVWSPVTGTIGLANPDSNNFIVVPTAFLTGAAASSAFSTAIAGASDAVKINYLSPSVNGLRLGLTYTPSTDNASTPPETGGNDGDANQVYDATLRYSGKMGGSNLNAVFSYVEQHGNALNSWSAWRTGVSATFGNITVGAAMKQVDNIDTGKGGTANSDEEEVFDVGLRYKVDDKTNVGIAFLHGEQPLASGTAGEDEGDKWSIGATYAVGPGVTLSGQVLYVDWTNESTADADNNNGWAAIGGLQVNF